MRHSRRRLIMAAVSGLALTALIAGPATVAAKRSTDVRFATFAGQSVT